MQGQGQGQGENLKAKSGSVQQVHKCKCEVMQAQDKQGNCNHEWLMYLYCCGSSLCKAFGPTKSTESRLSPAGSTGRMPGRPGRVIFPRTHQASTCEKMHFTLLRLLSSTVAYAAGH
jgi:hypothetical protein